MASLLCSRPQFAVTKKAVCGSKRKICQLSDSFDFDITTLEKENKQVRAAMLKKRFANTIFKAEQQLVHGKEYDEKKVQKELGEEQEKSKYLKRQKEREAARIAIGSIKRTLNFGDNLIAEREILTMIGKGFDEHKEKQVWEEIEKAKLKLQRQREREAARVALESIKRTVDFGDNLIAEREILTLIGKGFDGRKEKQVWEEIKKAKLTLQRQKERENARAALESIKRTVDFGDALEAEREFMMQIRAA